ncbi:NADPH2:quinone reductase [Halopseudomonas xinjiangensis]|uniref:NADPH2:quinone reductase n=1 Tax=Halopseudomonas xinjiangensis TaxID=487184 RepID=A0A1H1U0J4_9GAMM|nr:zinc-binding dehydrogenase [Halopseudomonas xinjiangensis]SDS65756.1 NADPH2:quinone reductase [Halopseudomonas xinjiangensis]
MNEEHIRQGLELRSLITSEGKLELSLVEVDVPSPRPDQVVIEVRATPINPSDLGLLTGPADLSSARFGGSAERPTVTAEVADSRLDGLKARLDQSMPVGNEGAGVVVAAGSDAQHLMGKTVAVLGGSMYAQYRVIRASECLVLPEGADPADGASCFVNPMTALSMVENMRLDGHSALVHTAAASNLGQMLNRICLADGVGLVNIVRSQEQAEILRKIGAEFVCDSTSASFESELTDAIHATGATLAFDAIGGGKLPSQILASMEVAANRSATAYSRYGSATHKQVYLYGNLDTRPTELHRTFGMAWGVGGWLLTSFLQRAGGDVAQRMKQRIAAELNTTFKSHYTAEIGLADALKEETLRAYTRRATGEKYLINPARGHSD